MDVLLSCGNVTLTPGLYNCGVFFFLVQPVPVLLPFLPTVFLSPPDPRPPLLSLKREKIVTGLVSFQVWFDQLGSIISGGLGRGERKTATSLFHFTIICVFPHLPVFEVHNINLTFFLALWLLIIFPLALIFFSVWFC